MVKNCPMANLLNYNGIIVMKDKTVILIGNNIQNTLGKARSFGEVGYSPILIWVGPRTNLVKYSCYVKEYYEVDTAEKAVEVLIKKFERPKVKTLVSVEGDGLIAELDKNYDRLKGSFIFYNAGEQGRLSMYLQKEELCAAAEQCGFLVPKTKLMNVGDSKHGLKYPIFTKASDSYDISWKSSAHIIKTEEELLQLYSQLKCPDILLQEFVVKKNELMLEGVSINGGKEVYIPIQGSYYRCPSDAYGSYGYFEKCQGHEDLVNSTRKLLELIRYSGIFEVEFLIDRQNNYYFLEINLRDTIWNYSFTKMGVNLNQIWAESEENGKLCLDSVGRVIDRINSMNEFTDFRRSVKTREMSFKDWYKDFKSSDALMIWNKKDNKPFRKYLLFVVARKMQQIGFFRKKNFQI